MVTETPDNFTEETNPARDQDSFTEYIDDALTKKEPIIILHQDWAGHYLVIIGHDTMGTEYTGDDVLIIADPYDTTDHRQDGYNIWSLERFYSLFTTKVELILDDTQNRLFFIRVKRAN